VLDAIVATAWAQRRLSHDEQVVLTHSVGHLADGPALVNAVLARCPEIPTRAWLGRRLRGHPVSCPKVRHRVPELTSRLPCHCLFETSPQSYPTPLAHLEVP
jgi:hypothetical protein